MTALLLLSKIIVCSAIFWSYYWLFLRNKKFHHYNRFYLLASVILSVILPLIKLPVFLDDESSAHQIAYRAIETFSANNWKGISESSATTYPNQILTVENGLFIVYVVGVLILLLSFAKSLLVITRIAKKYPFEFLEDLKFYNTTEPGTPFSFFKSIFWNIKLEHTTREGQQVLRHEIFHVRQFHSADILLIEVMSILLWFNPFFHLIKKELKAIHEFLADQYAISDNDRYAYAEFLLTETIRANKFSISNYFFQNHIKRRIAMITKFNKAGYSYWSRMMVLPVLFVVFCAIALYAEKPAPKVMSIETVPQGKVEEPGIPMYDTVPSAKDSIVEKKLKLQQELKDLENRILELKKMEIRMQLENQKNEIKRESILKEQEHRELEIQKMQQLQNRANEKQKQYQNDLQLRNEEERALQLQKIRELQMDRMNRQHEQQNEARLKLLEQKELELQRIREEKLEKPRKGQGRVAEDELKYRKKREAQMKKEYDKRMEAFEEKLQHQKELELKFNEQRELQLRKMQELELEILKQKMLNQNEIIKEKMLKPEGKKNMKPKSLPRKKSQSLYKKKKEPTVEL